MELVVRAIPNGQWIDITVDSISCTFNQNAQSPMASVSKVLGIDRDLLFGGYQRRELNDEQFHVHIHRTCSPLFLTTSKMRTWDDATHATSEITRVANAEGCRSLCMTHFMCILGKFPTAAFFHCLQMAAITEHQDHLEKVIIDVDERYIDVARNLLKKVHSQQAYMRKFNLSKGRTLGMAEAGSPDNQGILAAEVLVRSTHEDRCVEALKWLILANHIRQTTDPDKKYAQFGPALEFLHFAMEKEQVDQAYSRVENWLNQKFDDQSATEEFVPEFLEYMGK